MKFDESYPAVDLVVPTYNSRHFILESIKEIVAHRKLFKRIIFVDDGSTDETVALLGPYIGTIELIRLTENKGQHHATRVGLSASSAKYVVTLDDDLPVSLSEIEKLIMFAEKCDADLIYGSYKTSGKSFAQALGSWLVYRIMSKRFGLPQEGSSTRIIQQSIIESLETSNSSFLDNNLLQQANRIEFFTLQVKEKAYKSRYTIKDRINLFAKMLLRK